MRGLDKETKARGEGEEGTFKQGLKDGGHFTRLGRKGGWKEEKRVL